MFDWLASLGVEEDEMRRVFNLGLGYAAVVAEESTELALRTLDAGGPAGLGGRRVWSRATGCALR